MGSKASSRPVSILLVALALIVTLSLTASVLFAAITLTRNFPSVTVGQVGTLSATITNNTITVANEMDCVVRASPLASGITFGSGWTLQENGWYYLNRIISKDDANKTLSVTGATASNIAVELMQTGYTLEDEKPNAGFIVEWAERDMLNTSDGHLGGVTTDGLDLSYGGGDYQAEIVMFSGHDETRRLPASTGTSADTNHFRATKTGAYYNFNEVSIDGSTYTAINNSNAIIMYNNSHVQTIYAIEIVNGGHSAIKGTTFPGWTTYVDNGGGAAWVLGSSSSASATGKTYIVSPPLNPGEYVTLCNGTGAQIYFPSSVTETTTPLRFTVSSIDTMTFYYQYLKSPTTNKYLAWLTALGGDHYDNFTKLLTN